VSAPTTAPASQHPSPRWARDTRIVLRAVLPHPSLWWEACASLLRLAQRGWWRRPPFLPLPGPEYWRFRLVTAYGGEGDGDALAPADVLAYLRWCQKARPRRG
jgi:hypothetical protein